MNDYLNAQNLKYDKPKYDEMSRFLNHILIIAKSNPDVRITKQMVYTELKKCTLSAKDLETYGRPKNNRYMFKKWIKNFEKVKNIEVLNSEDWIYWCQFRNNLFTDDFIKIYIPLDSEGLEQGVSDIFNFMAQNEMRHQSKVASDLRNDNIVIRLDYHDEKSLKMLINYINNNPIIRQHLNPVNPFLPSIDGIGVMNETGISYNNEISSMISDYINKNRHLDKIDVYDFISYTKEHTYLKEVYQAFAHATDNKTQYFDPYEEIEGVINTKDKRTLTTLQKQSLLNDCIIATYEKYGMQQVLLALSGVIKQGTYKYFTNGNYGYRNLIRQNIKPDEIETMVVNTISQITNKYYFKKMDAIIDYCEYLLEDTMIKKLDEMCQVTLENYNKDYLSRAISAYCLYNHHDGFSRYKKDEIGYYKKNYRENCKYFTPQSMIKTMRKSMNIRGIQTENIEDDDLLFHYSSVLNSSDYKVALDKDNDVKIYR